MAFPKLLIQQVLVDASTSHYAKCYSPKISFLVSNTEHLCFSFRTIRRIAHYTWKVDQQKVSMIIHFVGNKIET